MGRLFVVASVFFVSLSSLVGCASRREPAHPTVDEAWVPKDSLDVSIKSDDSVKHAKVTTEEAMSCRPNPQEKPTIGAIHPAVN